MPVQITPDGRYLIVRGRLWRASDPSLSDARRQQHVDALMEARRAVKAAKADDDSAALQSARAAVDAAKRALGERGPPWWSDGAPDYTRTLVKNSPYAAWYAARKAGASRGG